MMHHPAHHTAPSLFQRGLAAIVATTILFAQAAPGLTETPAGSLDETFTHLSYERMLADIRTLSSPDFNGRLAGSDDDLRSAQWIAREFAAAGLQLPALSNGSLRFPFIRDRKSTRLNSSH